MMVELRVEAVLADDQYDVIDLDRCDGQKEASQAEM